MKNLLIAVTALFLTLTLVAQKPCPMPNGRPGKPGMGMQHRPQKDAFSKLNLTTAQQDALKKEKEKFRTDMQALNQKENITVKAQRDQREALVKAHKASMEKVLTPDQKNQLADMRTQAQAKRKAQMEEHFTRMKTDLNLTETQVSTLKANAEKRQTQMQALKADDKMDRVARHEAMKKIHEDARAEMKKVLTPEQFEKWQDMRPGGMQQRGKGHGKGHGPQFGR